MIQKTSFSFSAALTALASRTIISEYVKQMHKEANKGKNILKQKKKLERVDLEKKKILNLKIKQLSYVDIN
jgi:hypothetical protein